MAERWLVIDDSATIQRVIKLAFQDYDVILTEADSCIEAGREIQRVAPHLIIADAAVTGAKSVQDFVSLRNPLPQTPFIILEGSYDNIDENQFRGAGFLHFLKKPFDAAQLLAVTRMALGRALPQRNASHQTIPPPPSQQRHAKAEESFGQPPIPPQVPSGFDLGIQEARSPHKPPPMEAAPAPQRTESWPAVETGAWIEGQAGRRPVSFSLEDEPEAEVHTAPLRWEKQGHSSASNVNSLLEPMLKDDMERWVRSVVEEFCRKNFGPIAREMIGRELERLTQERARLLVDK
jgi:CheY-like chemotaxis protein